MCAVHQHAPSIVAMTWFQHPDRNACVGLLEHKRVPLLYEETIIEALVSCVSA